MKPQLTKELFTELYAKGIPIAKIIETLNISRRTVDYWRRAAGLPRRRRLI